MLSTSHAMNTAGKASVLVNYVLKQLERLAEK